jgi:hypothetical protein
METCDLLVVGGGSAGIAAALSAARLGASVVLAEQHSSLGGMGSAALVHTFCGLYKLNEEAPVFANEGLATELPQRLQAAGAAANPVRMGRLWVLPHEPALFAREAAKWIASEPRIQFHPSTSLVSAEQHDDRLQEVGLASQGGMRKLRPLAAIDATGDAALASLLGCAVASAASSQLQRPAFVFKLAGMPHAWLERDGRLQLAASVAQAVRFGSLPAEALGASIREGMRREDCWCSIDLPGDPSGDYNALDEGCRTRLYEIGRQTAEALCVHFQKVTSSKMEIAELPQVAGIRESNRLIGASTLTGAQVLGGTQFSDGIAEISWPMEMRETAGGPKLRFSNGPKAAQIPAGCLRSASVSNLFAAGRCLSADHEAQAAIRVMGMCLATGQAAAFEALGINHHTPRKQNFAASAIA